VLIIRTIRLVVQSSPSNGGTRVGIYLALAAALVQLAFAGRAFKASGEPPSTVRTT